MEIDPTTTTIVGALAAAIALAAVRLIRAGAEWLELRILAAAERSRRREIRRQRRESSGPQLLPKKSQAAPETFEDEVTDMHELVTLEREEKRRKSHRGERPPRPGTHHDKG